MSFNEFPEIPFFVKGYFDEFFKNIEALESNVLSLQDLIELWHIDGKNECLSLDNIMYLHRVLFNLRHLRVRNLPLVELAGKKELSHAYYEKLLTLYSKELHLIKCSLVKWLKTSFPIENEREFSFIDKLKMREPGFRWDGNDQAQGFSDDDIWSVAYFPIYGPLWYRDNVGIVSASIVAELENIGVYCHEFGHQLNVPDLYDVTGSGINYVNNWGLMDAGAWNGVSGTSPAHMMGWSKNFLGLIPDENIRIVNDNDVVLVTVDDLETGGDNFTLIKLPL